eukprot:CAMPEP_0176186472 /NCGR_PEP_ID=MMETSP0121_2-20121125/1887_1 /TAXON_ID=160619 /ORGANISM="Kryptoperidinium foliaceum, Strain CCMP 1326" /LENGTH=256 /DNA_ID=CAMNT_0017524957 /DNA_START=1 /DNA_END=771 /DNA_ORIENTATION=+
MADLSNTVLGFLGCGKISSAVCRGYGGAVGAHRPKKILVSVRSEDKSRALQAAFPDLVEIVASNEFGLLPGVARDLLPTLPFTSEKLVVSMMAAVDLKETLELTKMPADKLVRTVPLPSAAIRSGPILVHPPNATIEPILSVVSTPVPCAEEANMKPMVSVTGHISSFYELMNTTQKFIMDNGVERETARKFVAAFYASLAHGTELSSETLEDMAEEAATPGGLNAQSWSHLKTTEHYNLQYKSLESIHDRLQGKK